MTFNEAVHIELLQLVERWRRIERQIKRVEKIQQSVVIASINELRYAGRQIFELPAFFVQAKPLKPFEKSIIKRRLIVADQYLRNAEHDIVDALMGYFGEITLAANEAVGKTKIIEYFDEYPLFLKALAECGNRIDDSRADSNKRQETYDYIYGRLEELIGFHNRFLDAEVSARFNIERIEFERDQVKYELGLIEHQRDKIRADLELSDKKKKLLEKINLGLAIFGGFSGVITIISALFGILVWKYAYSTVCVEDFSGWMRYLCKILG